MKDRHGIEYSEALSIQRDHLTRWSELLRPAVLQPMKEYVLRHNREAGKSEDVHQVWRGQHLVTIILHWPELPAPYPPVHDATPAELI